MNSFELTDEMLAQATSKVNEINKDLRNKINETNWQLINVDTQPRQSHLPENQELYRINKAYNQIEHSAKQNNLTDSFRTEKNQEINSRTTRSLEKAIDRYTRQYTILQAHC